ncbi:hypothetical protein CON65_16310 [Bacillus pseudomycoides]|uniref:Uncharacterized protein n=1 Tax=Bacillus pseudomycoides TaxID=64104 RepID=A0AA91VAE7_9BACI|nr:MULTISPECIES: DUF5381 family protein [Bacillus]PEB48618.1 hypothetical protein COO03_24085 [Bacillus sp. AFS098217]PED81571.1 hypothetical protein CON65_16310 [Bacillus pseudomycoides]PEU15571.1 hypothetical protein CN525_16735 [Bacillus sp. AFS014408]PEU16387.1 hypothetical protein CN524_04825 [Bacillus sp. AFS019443]PFW65140.1 hypothetical protein COL20_01405 [Bacillus sp. AFS075034]
MNDKSIKKTNKGIEVTFSNFDAGCAIICGFIMVAVGIYLFIGPSDEHWLLRIPYFIMGIITLSFFGSILMKILTVVIRRKTLLTITSNGIVCKKRVVYFSEIENMYIGWHNKRLRGLVFKDLIIYTKSGEKFFVCTYNISDTEIQAAIEQYVLPYVDKYCLARWRNQMGNPTKHMKKED